MLFDVCSNVLFFGSGHVGVFSRDNLKVRSIRSQAGSVRLVLYIIFPEVIPPSNISLSQPVQERYDCLL